jgi:hypothetical protein
LVPVLAAVAVAALVVPLQAQASTDPRRPDGGATAAQHHPQPTPTGNGHPTGRHTVPAATPSPGLTGGTKGHHDPGGPNGLGGTQPGGWHNPGNPNLPHCGTVPGGVAGQTPSPGQLGQLVVDGGFERPRLPAGTDHKLYDQATVPGWRTDDPHGLIGLWNGARLGVAAVEGRQFAEIGAGGSLFQDLRTAPGSTLTWSVSIRARDTTAGSPDVDTTQVHFGPSPRPGQGGAQGAVGAFTYRNSTDDTHWKTLYGYYDVPSGQTWTRLSLTSIAHAGETGHGNLVDKISVAGMQC